MKHRPPAVDLAQKVHPRSFFTWASERHHACLMEVLDLLPRGRDEYADEYMQLAWMNGSDSAADLVVMSRCGYSQELLADVEELTSLKIEEKIRGQA